MAGLAERYLAAVLAGEFANALAVAREAQERGIPFLYEEVVTPALIQVGRLWQEGRLSVADEHIASALTQSVLASLYPSFPWAAGGPKGIVACVAGERHELGARMAADLFACDGWSIKFVGSDVPLDALEALVARELPIFVGLSLSLIEHLPILRAAVPRLRRQVPGLKVLVGGRAAGIERSSLSEVGADQIATSAAGAVNMIRPWKP